MLVGAVYPGLDSQEWGNPIFFMPMLLMDRPQVHFQSLYAPKQGKGGYIIPRDRVFFGGPPSVRGQAERSPRHTGKPDPYVDGPVRTGGDVGMTWSDGSNPAPTNPFR